MMMAKEKRLIDANILESWIDGGIQGAEEGNGIAPIVNLHDVLRELDNIPTVDAVEVVHGWWDDIADKCEKLVEKHDFRCSVCNNRASVFVGGTEDWWDMWKPNYCPNCGAKMDG